ncbi:type III pantothenate kinase [Dyella nitratireducens]|uniref:Type III pantothenate kinase n=1 Tax=Dyella nitratireducens TaxID=1849580 RepID=A0ABQ1FR88_9GAMM|nr:type III pantothenate kinase [Dyella nitratireducens]GGA24420.1 type III pantothenate kinase [Dyella nitratireducens]GLQ43826.1 type III pantothenate kinase [Dyella nitratireducens]
MRLLLDLGNTRLKWALVSADNWVARGAAAWEEDVSAALTQAWREQGQPQQVLGASVVDASREAQIESIVAEVFARPVDWVRTPAEACGVRIAYAEPQRLGVDRFLAMVAAHAAGASPCVLAGIGTALTLDALTADGQHLGGLIAPGPLLMQQSLFGATARVKPYQPGAIRDIADNTADAVVSGCWQAVAALIERFATKVAKQSGGTPCLLLDGGDAATLLPLLGLPAELAADSVLRGLNVWAATSNRLSHPSHPSS